MHTIFHPASSRGSADHGWLRSHHTFSFADYHDPKRMGFGALRVINDDEIAPGMGFSTHPHRDMEIVTVPLSGALRHQDSTGRTEVIHKGEVQIMSAGTGIRHSEMNASTTEPASLLQIWVLPEKMGIEPRYEQREFPEAGRKNRIQTIVSPNRQDHSLWINQQAYFSLLNLDKGKEISYSLQGSENGVYVFLISGSVEVAGHQLSARDGIGILGSPQLRANEQSELLFIEVPV